MTTPPAPGWYPNPAGDGSYRYWDGLNWTDAAPPNGPGAPAPGYANPATTLQPAKSGMSRGMKIGIGVGALALALIAIGSVGGNDKTSSSSKTVTATATKYAEAPETATPTKPTITGPATSIDADGTFVIGTDILPGRYRTAGGSKCYWERQSGLGGSFSEIISNSSAEGQQVVEIAPTDAAFETRGCGFWEKIG